MRTDSQARAASRREAIRKLAEMSAPDRLWDTYDALLDLGVSIEEIERAILHED